LPSWDQVRHAQELRNALVHNQGQLHELVPEDEARLPTDARRGLHGFAPPADDAGLIDHQVIPLSFKMSTG
jgi:hypothetical protein